MAQAKSATVPSGVKIIPRRRVFDDVTERLRELILDGTLAPGTRLRQEELAELLGISRTPLREAFRILERDGLLRISNGNKTVEVVDHSIEETVQMYEVREVLDGLAARLAAERGLTPAFRQRCERDLETMKHASSPISIPKYAAAHTDFHIALFEASGNESLIRRVPMVRSTWQMTLSRRMRSGDDPTLDEAIVEGNSQHQAIYDAIIAGDADAAERLARRHVRHTIRALSRRR